MERSSNKVWQDTLVLRAQAGDISSMELLVGIWYKKLLALAWRLTGNRELAMEACQEGWLAISRNIYRLEDPAKFAAWARQIVANKSVDLIRRSARQRRYITDTGHAEDALETSRQDTQDGADDISSIRVALRNMPEHKRLILSLYYLDGMSIARIAELIGIPHGTVKSRLFHARTELKEIVNGAENDKH